MAINGFDSNYFVKAPGESDASYKKRMEDYARGRGATVPGDTANARPVQPQADSGPWDKNLKYGAKMLTYPERLMGDPDLPHYVRFFINIRGASKWKNDARYRNNAAVPPEERGGNNSQKLGSNVNDLVKLGAAAAGGYAAVRGAQAITGRYGGNLGGRSKLAVTAGAGLLGAGAATALATSAMKGFQPDQTFRIESVIDLAIQERPSVRYGVDYVSTDLGLAAGILQGGGSVTDAVTNAAMNPEVARSVLMNVAEIPSAIANALGSDFSIGNLMAAATKTTPNPFREQLFKAVDNREFQFNYKFLPRTESEAAAVENIIKMFKFHMHPELSARGLFYVYPSEFNIVYYYKGKENSHINKISTCVLKNMNVDYGSQGGFNTFRNGMPTEINLSLSFLELEVLTKERVVKGF